MLLFLFYFIHDEFSRIADHSDVYVYIDVWYMHTIICWILTSYSIRTIDPTGLAAQTSL